MAKNSAPNQRQPEPASETPEQFEERTRREAAEAAEAGAPWPEDVLAARLAARPGSA